MPKITVVLDAGVLTALRARAVWAGRSLTKQVEWEIRQAEVKEGERRVPVSMEEFRERVTEGAQAPEGGPPIYSTEGGGTWPERPLSPQDLQPGRMVEEGVLSAEPLPPLERREPGVPPFPVTEVPLKCTCGRGLRGKHSKWCPVKLEGK